MISCPIQRLNGVPPERTELAERQTFIFLERKVSVGHWHGHIELMTAITVTQGYSLVALHIAQKDFRAVIDEMIAVDPDAMLAALPAIKLAAESAATEKQKLLERRF